jgi:hypothetical protein
MEEQGRLARFRPHRMDRVVPAVRQEFSSQVLKLLVQIERAVNASHPKHERLGASWGSEAHLRSATQERQVAGLVSEVMMRFMHRLANSLAAVDPDDSAVPLRVAIRRDQNAVRVHRSPASCCGATGSILRTFFLTFWTVATTIKRQTERCLASCLSALVVVVVHRDRRQGKSESQNATSFSRTGGVRHFQPDAFTGQDQVSAAIQAQHPPRREVMENRQPPKKPRPRRDEKLSLAPLTPEQAIFKALNTPKPPKPDGKKPPAK